MHHRSDESAVVLKNANRARSGFRAISSLPPSLFPSLTELAIDVQHVVKRYADHSP